MCSCRGHRACKQCSRLYKRCSCKQWPCTYMAPCAANLLGRIPNPHSRPALAAPQHAPGPRSDARSQRTPPGRSSTDQQHHPAAAPAGKHLAPPAHPRSDRPAASPDTCSIPTRPRSDTQPPTLEAVQHPRPCTIRPTDSTKARPTIKPDRLFLLPAAHQPRRMSTETRCTLASPTGKAGSSSLDTATGSTSARADGAGIASPSRCAARR